jgi:O-antigen/teichoic acid export membrane protein
MSNTETIAKNAGWYGLESVISVLVTMFTSIVIARMLGPAKMGYIIYVIWVAEVANRLGGLGIPATMRKYMAEYLGKGDCGTARHVYLHTLRLQMGVAGFATASVLVWALRDAGAEYRWAAACISVSVWPAMVNSISAQANIAAEQLRANLPASFASILTFLFCVLFTAFFHWGVLGFAASMLVMRVVDFSVRLVPTLRRTLLWKATAPLPDHLERRMLRFALQSVTSTLVALIVWDRSEFFLLKHMCADIRQVAFYSVAFSLAERLLLSASIFGTAIGATIFAQYGRDRSRTPEITASAFRYLALSSVPLHIVASALAGPALLLLYGQQYRGAVLVATLAPIFCLPKAFLEPARNLLQSEDRQGIVIWATALAGIVDLSVAWALIPAHGAVGACIGSGAGQITAIGILWGANIRLLKVKIPWVFALKIAGISTAASVTSHYLVLRMHPALAVVCGLCCAMTVFFGLLYVSRLLEPSDFARLGSVAAMLPRPLANFARLWSSQLVPQTKDQTPVSKPPRTDGCGRSPDEHASREHAQLGESL